MTTPNLTVHHLQVGQGERIPWLLEELNIPYTLHLYQRSPILSPPALKALHPMGASPVLEDATSDTAHPLKLAESGAIVEYIIQRYGNGRLALPPSHKAYPDYLYWFHFANANLQPAIMRRMTAKHLVASTDDPRYQMADQRMQIVLQHLNGRLEANAWLAGEDFTSADVMSVFTLTTMRRFEPLDLSAFLAILDWLKRCTSREAYRVAMRKSDPELDVEEGVSAEGPRLFEGLAKAAAALAEQK